MNTTTEKKFGPTVTPPNRETRGPEERMIQTVRAHADDASLKFGNQGYRNFKEDFELQRSSLFICCREREEKAVSIALCCSSASPRWRQNLTSWSLITSPGSAPALKPRIAIEIRLRLQTATRTEHHHRVQTQPPIHAWAGQNRPPSTGRTYHRSRTEHNQPSVARTEPSGD
ncbi:glutamate racemase [Striga asiatica]|uniref:Glutamate racemase n=1 Tax=Striga asiatica TaxID=4170 RepID=A0A5A7P9N4_STRAF|nr:glutamate racemase [Striga asiatica]